MELIPNNQQLFIVLFSLSISIGLFFLSFSRKKISKILKKSRSKKLLLKEMLESFGLDVPQELEESGANLIKSVKNS